MHWFRCAAWAFVPPPQIPSSCFYSTSTELGWFGRRRGKKKMQDLETLTRTLVEHAIPNATSTMVAHLDDMTARLEALEGGGEFRSGEVDTENRMNDLEKRLVARIVDLESKNKDLESKLSEIDDKIEGCKDETEGTDHRVDDVDSQVGDVTERLGVVEESLHDKVSALEFEKSLVRLKELESKEENLEERVTDVEDKTVPRLDTVEKIANGLLESFNKVVLDDEKLAEVIRDHSATKEETGERLDAVERGIEALFSISKLEYESITKIESDLHEESEDESDADDAESDTDDESDAYDDESEYESDEETEDDESDEDLNESEHESEEEIDDDDDW